MEKAFELQKQIRNNASTLHSYMTDLQNWEAEMKRKEAALDGQYEQELPPVRSKIKKEKPIQTVKTPEKRITSSDYEGWEKFDVAQTNSSLNRDLSPSRCENLGDKACEDIDMCEVGPVSLDSKKSQKVKMDKLRDEAQYEKERGNVFVKQEKWEDAIKCYNRAIELVKDDPIYYANRGLCHLKKDSLHQAETDCTEALRLDPTYVKALQRRASAREKLGSLRSASNDLCEVLKLEPNNHQARRQLDSIRARMGTKGPKSKSSPLPTPTLEDKSITTAGAKMKIQPKIQEIESSMGDAKETSPDDKWREGVGENITVIKNVKKPPHLRSKRPLKSVPIQEILLGKVEPEKPGTRLKIVEIDNNLARGDDNNNNNDSNKLENSENEKTELKGDGDKVDKEILNVTSPESLKLITDVVFNTEKDVKSLVAPVNSVQFMTTWKELRGNDKARSDYLSIIEPSRIPSIFENALESDVLSELLKALHVGLDQFKERSVSAYLRGFSGVKRFSALAMFLSTQDKDLLNKLLEYCRREEMCSDDLLADLKNKYEL